MRGLTLFKRDSANALVLASWHGPAQRAWRWRLSWQRDNSGPRATVRVFVLGTFVRNLSVHFFGRRILRLLWQPRAISDGA